MSSFHKLQWQERASFLGLSSTDMRRLANGEWSRLYDEKMGLAPAVDLSWTWKPRLGLHTESLHSAWHARMECAQTSQPALLCPDVDAHGRGYATSHGDWHPLVIGKNAVAFTSIDRWVTDDDCPLELKHTHAANSLRACANDYMAQLQWQMMVTGASRLRFSIIKGNEEPEWGYVEADQDFQDRMLNMARQFWKMIEAEIRPEDPGVDRELAAKAPTIKVNGSRDYDRATLPSANEFIAKAVSYIADKPAADRFKETDKELRAMIPADAATVRAGGLTCKRDKRGAVRITIDEGPGAPGLPA